jgi:chemotaxis protein MotB
VGLALLAVLSPSTGCAIVPRSRFDECKQLSRTLRSENARLKDQVFALQSQNRDYAERAVDDARRLAIQDESIERLVHSVQAYQDERARLEAAYKRIASNLGIEGRRTENQGAP